MSVTETPPYVVAVTPHSPADGAGLCTFDEIVSVNGIRPRDVIEWRVLTDAPVVDLQISRGGTIFDVLVEKSEGEPLGVEVSSSVFDRVRTCDNHCPFCFIYQLPAGLRTSLYLKDDDYRLSFLYGNFTTLTRFTESDLERIVEEGLSPLNVSIHSCDPNLRSVLLRNKRGSTSLRWLRELLKRGVRVNGQIVVCPGINDGSELESTLRSILDQYPDLHSVAVVPLGVSSFNSEPTMRVHTPDEACRVLDIVSEWQDRFMAALGRRMVFAADEYFIMAGRDFPQPEIYGDFHLHEDGVGMARAFSLEFEGARQHSIGTQSGFFSWVDGAPAEGYRAVRNPTADTALRNHDPSHGHSSNPVPISLSRSVEVRSRRREHDSPRSIAILTSEYGSVVLRPLIESLRREDIRIIPIRNEFFGGNISVTGLLVGSDVSSALEGQPDDDRFLLPDVCLSEGRFLDGMSIDQLPRSVEIVPTDGISLRRALERRT